MQVARSAQIKVDCLLVMSKDSSSVLIARWQLDMGQCGG